MGYGYGHSSSSWLFLLLPLALLAVRMLASGRRRGGSRRPQAPPSFFVGHPSPPGSVPTAPPPDAIGSETTGTPAGWFTDPFVKHEQRYWSGTEWTEHVLDDGVPDNDPPPSSSASSAGETP
jgi:Protein of unknown function (DUF2510)